MKTLIFGTTNSAKVAQIQGVLKPLGIVVEPLPESARSVAIVEDGETAEANARKKALAYAQVIGQPVFSMDNALYLDGLSALEQPGMHVRRVASASDRPSDEEVLKHYSALIARLGGRVGGGFHFALCFARPDGTYVERTVVSRHIFVETPSKTVIKGYPLESMQVEPTFGRYVSEMSELDRDLLWQQKIGTELASFIQSITD